MGLRIALLVETPMACFVALLSLLLLAPAAAAQDLKDLADALARGIRTHQNEDGSYGAGLADTCRVLDALGRSPRRYTDLDGPFVRRAAQRVAAAEPQAQTDALVALALAGSLTPSLAAAREAALERVLAAPGEPSYEAALALTTLRPEALRRGTATTADPALACLLATDPASVPAPAVSETVAWTRWARAALLRGLVPTEQPSPPAEPAPQATLADVVAALETVNVLAGIKKPAATSTAPAASAGDVSSQPPERVSAGQDIAAALERAWTFLETHQHDGQFGLELAGWDGAEPGITALNLSAACWLADRLDRPRPAWIARGLDYLVGLQKADGAISAYGLDVYTTSVAIEALLAGGREQDGPVVERARQYLLAAQSDEGEGYSVESDPLYGGIGYGGDERPDLSNTHMAIEAASRAGTPTGDALFSKALVFLERCQNLGERSVNTWPRAAGGTLVSGTDGGSTYMPGNSPAGEIELGGGQWQARSYGSMTYALLKSYLFCGLEADDERVRAAVSWLGQNFTVEANPGFAKPADGAQGLYYYYLALARTLRLLPQALHDPEGRPIDWRGQLERKLLDEQRIDGSWINEGSPRWWEGAPTLCTAYALLALAAAGA
jgi:squalene-hopene/tetraprenyl-beta-curcumene cyclase